MENRRGWNTGKSHPISLIPSTQLSEAIREWSEGNPHLERLLWACHDNGLVTAGSCAHVPYLEFDIESCEIKSLNRLLFAMEQLNNFYIILLLKPGNPYSGPEWYKPRLTLRLSQKTSELEKNKIFNILTTALENKVINSPQTHISNVLNWYEFLKDKGSELIIRMKLQNGFYTIEFDFEKNQRNMAFYLPLCLKNGLRMSSQIPLDAPRMYFGYSTPNAAEFRFITQNLLKSFKDNWNLKPRVEVTDDIGFNIKAYVLRKKFGTDAEGIKKLNTWLNEDTSVEGHPMVNY